MQQPVEIMDLASRDLVRLRNGEIARVVGWISPDRLELSILALNGFGQVLWVEPSFQVDGKTGAASRYPSPLDVQSRVSIREKWFSYKVTSYPIARRSMTQATDNPRNIT